MAQSRIGDAEQRTQMLEAENIKIKGELQSWNEEYGQEEVPSVTAVSQPPVSASSSVFGVPASSDIQFPARSEEPSMTGSNFDTTMPMSIPMATPVSIPPIASVGRFDALGNYHPYGADEMQQNQAREIPSFTQQQSGRRDSFGSVFPGSSGTGGNGNGNGGTEFMTGRNQPSGTSCGKWLEY